MKPDLSNIYKETSSIYTKYFSPSIKKSIDEHLAFLNTYNQILDAFLLELNSIDEANEAIGIISLHKKLALEFFKLNEENFKKPDEDFFENDLKTFNTKFEKVLLTIDEIIIDFQNPEIFKILKEDTIWLKLKKRMVQSVRGMKGFSYRIVNMIGKIKKKPEVEYHAYRHTVPFRNLFDQYFRYELMEDQLQFYGEVKGKINGSFYRIMKSYDGFEIHSNETLSKANISQKEAISEGIKKCNALAEKEADEFKALIKEINARVKENVENIILDFEKAYQIAGTIELPASKLGKEPTARKKIELKSDYNRILRDWDNTLYAISEDWKFSLEIYILNYTAQIEITLLETSIDTGPEKKILDKMKKVEKALVQSSKIIENTPPHKAEMHAVLSEQKIQLKELLENKLIPEIIELLTEVDVPMMIDTQESKIKRSVDKISKQRLIVRNLDASKPLSSNDFTYVSPHELISFEIYPDIIRTLTEVKNAVMEKIINFQNETLTIAQITDFNIESALSGIDQEGLRSTSAKKGVMEGIDRSAEHIGEIMIGIGDLSNLTNSALQSAIDPFCKRIIKLSNTDNVFEIRLRIMKAKAIKQSTQLKEKVFDKANRFYDVIKIKVQLFSATGSEYTHQLKKLSGFDEEQVSLMTEISHYLASTEATVKKLPYVYQRLFRLEPLNDFRFFMGRTKEMEQLKEAFKNWKKGRFAPVAITAEKGSGMTSLIDYLLDNIEFEIHHIHLADYDDPTDLGRFLEVLETKFEGSSIKHVDDAKLYFNENSRKIIVIEGIQHLFLRKVNGFDSMNALMEIISETNDKVFWVCSCSFYAWEYLSRTMNIWDYFAYVIKFDPLSDEEMIDIIMKRHNVSGYKLDFDISIAEGEEKKLKNLTEEARWNLLKKEYFKKLNQFAKSNVSLALLYWIQSAKKTDDNMIRIGKIDKLNTQFMKYMRMEKIITMHLLLIHDGLTADQFVSIMGRNTERSKLHLNQMYEDGILIKKADMYLINPMLYRYTVNLLKSKNLIL